jgi:hypothetical protein
MIKDHHDGYIGWAEYERNQKQLAVNNSVVPEAQSPAGVAGHSCWG